METLYDQYSTRDAFGNALLEMAINNNQIFAVSADTEKSMGYSPMAKRFPSRVINVGICEANMALVAAGIAACGGKAFAATYAPFASMRIIEQIRTFIAYPNLDVKIVSGLAGLSGNIEGVTHQGLEDVSLLRCISNMTVVVPADACSTEEITRVITEYDGPVYLRIGRGPVPKVFDTYHFEIGKANVLKEEGSDAAIICNGVAVYRVIEAEKILKDKGFNVQIIEMPCVKPIDKNTIIKAAKSTGRLITVEENNVLGGLGGAVAEVVTSSDYPVKVLRLGIEDIYAESGSHNELLEKYGFSPATIAKKIEVFLTERI